MNPEFPVYIISKGRWDHPLTVRNLQSRGIPFHLVIEPTEYQHYSKVVDPGRILQLPFHDLGQGSIPARNWVWDHAMSLGHPFHWILDDNIRDFYRLNKNIKYRTTSGTTFKVIENFVLRYDNIALAGMHYESLTPRKRSRPPVVFNTRVYSCILINHQVPFRWRGKYNEDTDLAIRCLKDGWVTVLFNAFLADKIATMKMSGGNTDELYQGDGRLKMARSLQEQHPDVVKIVRKWNRWQHQVNYRPFKGNTLARKENVSIPGGINEFGMALVNVNDHLE